ncbi:aminopeptidase N [Georgenia sp. 10Sc9-8]|uniref:Aminopeptidase N n=1 Tax=Georgenia halotolerans TaxID=3028317 RepID=A0ABT5U1M0_9MICO|nr:aminopeptidase N [Georgenia halotolerans]
MSTANLSRTEARRRSASVQVRDHRVELDLSAATDPGRGTFRTTTTVRFAATEPETFLDFLGPRVHAVTVNGEPREVDVDGGRIHLAGLAAENEVRVEAEAAYSRTGEGLHRFVDPADGATYLYTQQEPADARRVFAGFDQPDLKARFTFVVTAPAGWHVLSNQPVTTTELGPHGTARWAFAATPPLSTYLTAVVAGPYHRVTGEWRAAGDAAGAAPLVVPLGVWCRASLAEHLDAEEVLTITRQGLDFFREHVAFPYPWGTYDQVFVPEYNLGAMENPGCVTLTESYVFRSAATRAQHQARATTVLHEMAHMWFGDLVTPRWWDDLWLKESFADYLGTHAVVAATQFTDAWAAFASRRKAWAYAQDQLPTTHPVVADIPDVEAAKQNFDGVTYAKGAAVLKQLVAYVGEKAFFAGAQRYFARHAYGSTTLPDLLTELEGASGRDLGEWTRLWLHTSGPATLRARATLDEDDRLVRLEVHQDSRDPVTGAEVLRPHRLAVGLYHLTRGGLARSERVELDLTGRSVDVPGVAGLPAPDLVLVNDGDLTYGKVRLDDRSVATVREHLSALGDPLARAVVWSALWNSARDAVLPAADYLEAVLRHGPGESDTAVLQGLTANARTAVEHYLPPADRTAGRARWFDGAWHRLLEAPAGSDAQLVWARAVTGSGAAVPEAAGRLRALLEAEVPDLPMGPELRWATWQALAALGVASVGELDAELARDRTGEGVTQHLRALTSRPDPAVRARAWEALIHRTDLTNDQVDATIAGFTAPPRPRQGYAEAYFAVLRRLWQERSIEIASRLVRGLYPGQQDAAAGRRTDGHPVVRRTEEWLAGNEDAPAALRRLVIEQGDHLRRSLTAQGAAQA